MANIPAKLVNQLRERTGAPLMDCKRALEEASTTLGPSADEKQLLDTAEDLLRKKGLKNAEKRAGRKAGAGLVSVVSAPDARSAAVALMTSETDFVVKTDDFQQLLRKVAQLAFDKRIGSAGALLEQRLDGVPAAEALKSLTGKLGENIELPIVAYFDNKSGYVGGYVHHDLKTAGFASVTTNAPREKALEFLKQLGMHITFAKPTALAREHVPAEAVEREKAVHADSDEVKSKPADKREMIVKGKLEKFFAKEALVEQPWFTDDKQTVRKVLESSLGAGSKIEGFALLTLSA